MLKGRISEVFQSVQGEGIYFGEKQIFVRFSGCNLQCSFCDTRIDKFKEYDSDNLLSLIKSFGKGFHSVSFTGGEPLLQKDFLKEALPLVKKEGYKTYLETNATLPEALREVIDNVDIVAMDIKLPSSTRIMLDYWHKHYEFLKLANLKEVFVKAVICLTTTHNDILVMLKLLKSLNYAGLLILQPNSFDDYSLLKKKVEQFRQTCAEYSISSCVIPQLHKQIGVK